MRAFRAGLAAAGLIVLAGGAARGQAQVAPLTSPLETKLIDLQKQLDLLADRRNATEESIKHVHSDLDALKASEKDDLEGFRRNEDKLMAASTDNTTRFAAFVSVVMALIALLAGGAFVMNWRLSNKNERAIDDLRRRFRDDSELLIESLKLSHRSATAEALGEIARGQEAAAKSVQTLNTVREAQAEVEAAAQDVRQKQAELTKILDDEREAAFRRLYAQGPFARAEGRSFAAADPAALQRDADALARLPSRSPFDRHVADGLIAAARGDMAQARAAFAVAGEAADTEMRRAQADYLQAVALVASRDGREPGDMPDALELVDRVVARQAALANEAGGELLLARAQTIRAALKRKADPRATVAAYTWIIDRLAGATDLERQQLYAAALAHRGKAFDSAEINDTDAAQRDFAETIRRFADATDPLVRRQVAAAYYYDGLLLADRGPPSEPAAAAFDHAYELLADATDEEGRRMAAEVLKSRNEQVVAANSSP